MLTSRDAMAGWTNCAGLLADGLIRLLPLNWIAQAPQLHADLIAELPQGGIKGLSPLSWWAAGTYEGQLRRQLLHLRTAPKGPMVGALVRDLVIGLRLEPWTRPPLLVPIPSWKRRANPLPGLLGRSLSWQLGWRQACLLERSRPVLGQHHLGRELRWANQAGAFRCSPSAQLAKDRSHPVLLIDDILTTGATACAAAAALAEQGWQVAGMACLGRTPKKGRDLRSLSRAGDKPG